MVNVDGVVHGNSRCTLAGVDPNRVWPASSARRRNKEKMEIMNSLHELRHDPNPILHPVIFRAEEPPAQPFAGASKLRKMSEPL